MTPVRPTGARKPFRGLPGRGTTWCHGPLRIPHHGRCVRRPYSDSGSGSGTRHRSYVAAQCVVCLLLIIVGHHLPCPAVPFSQVPPGYGGDLWVARTGRRGPWPRRPRDGRVSAFGLGHRRTVVCRQTRGGRAGAHGGRRRSASHAPTGPRRAPAYHLCLHARRRLIEHAGCPRGVLVAHSLTRSPNAAPAQSLRWTCVSGDGLLLLAGDLDTARFGFPPTGMVQPQHSARHSWPRSVLRPAFSPIKQLAAEDASRRSAERHLAFRDPERAALGVRR